MLQRYYVQARTQISLPLSEVTLCHGAIVFKQKQPQFKSALLNADF